MDDGCPALKRRAFFHYPPFLDQHAVIGRWTIEKAESYGYPVAMIWQNLAEERAAEVAQHGRLDDGGPP